MHKSRVAMLILGAAAACASHTDAAPMSDSAGRRDSIAGVAALTMNEANILALLMQTHAADSALGALGAAKGSTDVAEFGRMILREHHALTGDVQDAAKQMALTPQQPRVPPDAPDTARLAALERGTAGAAWDRAYLDYAVALHESALENTARALAATKRPETKDFIRKSVPIIQKHLDKASALRKRAAGRTDSAKTP